MVLSPELIEHAEQKVNIATYYDVTDTCTPKHLVYKEFIEKTKWSGLPKLIFYILMDKSFGHLIQKAPNGDLGYCVKLLDHVAELDRLNQQNNKSENP